jgi:hypothetical protein
MAQMPADLSQTRVVVAVFAMHGCGPCEEFLPRFTAHVERFQRTGYPFVLLRPGAKLKPGQIPVMIYDAAADNTELQAFADRLGVAATPTTAMLTRRGVTKLEGSLEDTQIDQLLYAAAQANR